MPQWLRKVLYWTPFLASGPITGPLLEGIVRNWRKGEWVLVGLYLLAAVLGFYVVFFVLPGTIPPMLAYIKESWS